MSVAIAVSLWPKGCCFSLLSFLDVRLWAIVVSLLFAMSSQVHHDEWVLVTGQKLLDELENLKNLHCIR